MNDSAERFDKPGILVEKILTSYQPKNFHESKINRNTYLDIIERIARNAAPWVDEKGAVIDPVLKYEHGQTSSRFASTCATAIYFGRCPELKETLYKVMDHCCYMLKQPDSVDKSPDFWMRELVTAYKCLKAFAPKERLERWKKDLSCVIPEKNYKRVAKDLSTRHQLHNWAVYAAAGESMRYSAGISGPENELWGQEFFDEYMRHQLWRFNEYGMYRDPNDPITYDITTRLQFEIALASGYNGIWKEGLRKILDDAMYATLLFMAPSGEVPFGGRSSQFYFQEGIISALCELAASRYKTSNPKLAGAYKRQAHLSCAATFRGLLRNDGKLYHIKNYFPVNTLHGCDHYGLYSVYSLFAGSVFSLAALNADETIKEYPTISEIGGYSLGLPNNFYKLYCNNNGNYLEFELKNNIIEDACGLGRILMADLPWGLLPVLPFSKEPNYKLDPSLPKNTCFTSIAPEWTNKEGKVYSLAQQEEQIGQYSIVAPNIWKVTYNVWDATVEYIADLNIKNQITLEISVSGNAVNQIMVIPVLEFDGLNKVETTLSNNGFTSLMNGKKLEVTSNSNQATFAGTAVNRTGLYKRVILPMKNGKIKIVFSVK